MQNMVKADTTTVESVTAQLTRVREEIGKIIVGQRDVIDGVLICLLAGGHVLLEGVPGLGKTTLLRTLGRVLHLKYSRIQFTPDLMPGDIVGSMIMETDERGHQCFGSSRGRSSRIWFSLTKSIALRRKRSRLCLRQCRSAPSPAALPRYSLDAPFLVMATQNPDRDGRHLSAARSAARPVSDEDSGYLSVARRS